MRIWLFPAIAAVAASVACSGSGDAETLDLAAAGGQGGSAGAGGANPADSSVASDARDAGDAKDPGWADMPDDGGSVNAAAFIRCGQWLCALTWSRVCCVDNQSTTAFQCSDRGSCPASMQQPVELGCSSDANCSAGAVCCLSHSSGTRSVSRCQTACYAGDVHLCSPGATKNGCEAFQKCEPGAITSWGLPAASYSMCN
jgi:hypothetical protein